MAATPLSFNNGIYLSSQVIPNVEVGHMDKEHLLHLNGQNMFMTDLGMIEPWVLSGYSPTRSPFLTSIQPSSTIDVATDGKGRFQFHVPIPMGDFILLEDLSGTDKPGLDGTTFKARFNKKVVGKTAIISPSEWLDVSLYVEDLEREGDQIIYTFKLVGADSKDKYMPKQFLRPGQRFSIVSSAINEYDVEYNDLASVDGGVRNYYNYVGNTTANVHFTVTRDAAYTDVTDKAVIALDTYKEMFNIYRFKDGSKGDGNYQKDGKVMRPSDVMTNQEYQRSVKWKTQIPKVEAIAMMQVEADVRFNEMFGTGGSIQHRGGNTSHLPVGLLWQMQKGNLYSYNTGDKIIPMINGHLANLLKNKVMPYQGKPTITFKVGMGALQRVKDEMREIGKSTGFVFEAANYIKGSLPHDQILNLPDYSGYDDFGYAYVRFQHEPAFDRYKSDQVINPMVATKFGSFPLSSFIIMCEDLTNQGSLSDNIIRVRKKDYWEFSHRVEVGKLDYPANIPNRAFMSSNSNPGFRVFMEKPHTALWMKDPSKALIIRPFNPYTGRTLFSSFFENQF